MLKRLIRKHKAIDLKDLNNVLLIISLGVFLVSLYFLKNIYVLMLVYLFIYDLFYRRERNKYFKLLTGILPILIFACFLLRYIDLSSLSFDLINMLKIIIKALIFLDYLMIVVHEIRGKDIKYVKGKRGKNSLNDLRIKNIKRYKDCNLEVLNNYQIKNNLDLDSDYYKVLKNNLNQKIKNDLEEYVVINYLRFYKNRKNNKKNILDSLNILFVSIHVIILLLSILVK